MIRNDLKNLSDDELEKIMTPIEELLSEHLQEIMDGYIAFHIANKYFMDALWSESLITLIETALEDLENYKPDKEKIVSMLDKDYKLKVISENPIEIEEM